MKRLFLMAALCAGGSATSWAAMPPQKNWQADVSYSSYSGDYGTEEETDTRVLRFKFTRTFHEADASLTIPFVSVTGRSAVVTGTGKPSRSRPGTARTVENTESGLGDIVAGVHAILIEEQDERPELGGRLFVKLPTADEDDGLGTGEFDEGARLELYKTFESDYFGCLDLGYTVVGDPDGLNYNNRWLVSVGGGRRFDNRLSASAFYTEERATVDGESNARDLTFSVDFTLTTDAALYAALLLGLSDGSPDTGITVGGRLRFANPWK